MDKKIPHLRAKWANEVARAKIREKDLNTFEDFLKFLMVQKRVATELQELEGEKKEKLEERTGKTEDEEGFSVVNRK